MLPANLLIDLLVLSLTMRCLKLDGRKEIAKKAVLKIWVSGFVSDFIGTVVMVCAVLIDSFLDYQSPLGAWWYENITNAVALDPFETLPAFLWTAIRKKLALSLAVLTAPYLFLLPTAWFF